jgi:hypothetical protein
VFGKNYNWSLCAAKNMYKMFDSCVIAVAFQSVFYLKMHWNNVFLFFKNYFWYQVSKWYKNTKKNINLKQRKKNFNFFKSSFKIQKQTLFYETQLKKHVKTAS